MRTFDGAVVAVSHDRYLLDETVGEIAELNGGRDPHVAGQLLRVHDRARARAAAPAAAVRHPAEGDRAARGGDPPVQGLGEPRVVDERHIKQARNKQRQIDRMEKIDRPGARAAQDRARAAPARARRRARGRARRCRRRRSADGRSSTASTSTVLRGERVGIVGENGAGKSVLLRMLSRRARAGRGRAEGRPVDPVRPARAGSPARRPEGDAARARAPHGADLRGRSRVAADEVPVQLRAGAPAARHRSPAASGRGCSCCS